MLKWKNVLLFFAGLALLSNSSADFTPQPQPNPFVLYWPANETLPAFKEQLTWTPDADNVHWHVPYLCKSSQGTFTKFTATNENQPDLKVYYYIGDENNYLIKTRSYFDFIQGVTTACRRPAMLEKSKNI